MEKIIRVKHDQLLPHPHNMRVRYPLADVRRMALSQAERARQGLDPCVQPLVIAPHSQKRGCYVIIAGHLRHAGNAYLGDKAPLLNCLVRQYADDAQALSEMSAENGLRADISPLGWAQHFRRQLNLGRTLRQVCRDAGKSVSQVQTYLALLDLCPAAQALIDSGELPRGAGQALLQIADPQQQAAAARQFARNHATVAEMSATVQVVVASPRKKPGPKPRSASQANPAGRPSTATLPARHPAKFRDLREAARASCSACEISRPLPLAEPAWHLALAAAGETCDCCGLQNAKGACSSCPLVDMLKRAADARKG